MIQSLEEILRELQNQRADIDEEKARLEGMSNARAIKVRQAGAGYKEAIAERRKKMTGAPSMIAGNSFCREARRRNRYFEFLATPVNPEEGEQAGFCSDETIAYLGKRIGRLDIILKRLSENLAAKTAKLDMSQLKTDRKIKYLQEAVGMSGQVPKVSNSDYMALEEKGFYSLWIGDSPVFRLCGSSLEYLFSSRKDRPLMIKSEKAGAVMRETDLDMAKRVLGLEDGDFCNYRGFCLAGENLELASSVFDQAANGAVMLPSPTEPYGYAVRTTRTRGEGKVKPRHWGQEYLAQLEPQKITPGEILGGGGCYIAFSYSTGKTVVEFNEENRATYLFDTPYFESLASLNRRALIRCSPEGFNGRAIHKGDRKRWQQAIDAYVSETGMDFAEDLGMKILLKAGQE